MLQFLVYIVHGFAYKNFIQMKQHRWVVYLPLYSVCFVFEYRHTLEDGQICENNFFEWKKNNIVLCPINTSSSMISKNGYK